MTFLVLFIFPLLAYVFIPRVASSSDLSRDGNSDEAKLDQTTEIIDGDDYGISKHRAHGRPREDEQEQLVRHNRRKSRKHRKRQRERGTDDGEVDSIDVPTTLAPVARAHIENVGDNNDDLDRYEKESNDNPDALFSQSETTNQRSVRVNEENSKEHTAITERENLTHTSYNVDDMLTPRGDQSAQETEQKNDMNATQLDTEEAQPEVSQTNCPKCGRIEQERNLHIAMFKQTLLQKLGMQSAPKVDGPLPPLPFDFYLGEDFSVSDEASEEEEDRRAVKTREMFIFGSDVTHRCHKKKSTGCYSFNLTDKGLDPDAVTSVELWIYKQQDLNDHYIQTFMVSELDKSSRKIDGEYMLRHKNIAKRIETRLKYGWMKIYVTRTVSRWLSKPHRNNGLAVVCKTCQRQNHKTIYGYKEGMMPILVFYMHQNKGHGRRYKRETNCIGGNCCRRETLEINFQDIGWDYIMAPPSIRPNFCTGSCNGIQAAYYNHTRLVQTLQQSVMHNYGSQLQPCCSPVSFRHPQSLIYRDHEAVVRKIDIPDLIVGECGCI